MNCDEPNAYLRVSADQEDENVKNDCVEEDDGPRHLVAHYKTTLHSTTANDADDFFINIQQRPLHIYK